MKKQAGHEAEVDAHACLAIDLDAKVRPARQNLRQKILIWGRRAESNRLIERVGFMGSRSEQGVGHKFAATSTIVKAQFGDLLFAAPADRKLAFSFSSSA